MKAIVLVFCLILYCVSADDMRSCFKDADCKSDECCISMVFVRGFCHTLGEEGDHCIDKPAETEHGKKNLFGCPCRDGYKCVSDVIQEGEKTIYRNPTCRATDD